MTAPVFTAPEAAEDVTRMRGAFAVAAHAFHITPSGPEVWGWQGRTFGRRAGTSWLRVVSTPSEKAGGRLWEGTALADAAVPRTIPRPRLRNLMDWTHGSYAYRAELTEFITTPTVVTGSPVLDHDPNLPDTWWRDLHGASRALAAVPTDREAVRQSWIDRNFRAFLGIDPPWIHEHTTGHADLHWANLTAPTLIILDWEGWGRMPVGYDPGLLHAYSLPVPAVAARVRHEFADVLDTPAGRTGELVALGQLLQACSRGVHPHLAPLIARQAEHLIGAPIPSP
ncbi:hypothetical protein GCM10010275_55380 [Streptomyces litmocidini]|uniref:hypothetical protein n=1 Tax=Streptomyces litmocidini TaxID=67318 RepID=UPI00199BF566|nr:hypothetical protein [Streptomyces litmocidini]GGV08109.1 hypothetical protein GCM10010275_55380 [Streptomyces litmocidini]